MSVIESESLFYSISPVIFVENNIFCSCGMARLCIVTATYDADRWRVVELYKTSVYISDLTGPVYQPLFFGLIGEYLRLPTYLWN